MSIKKNMSNYDCSLSFLSKNEIDIVDYDFCEKKISEKNPEVVINCSAYTDVEKAEIDIPNAEALNVTAVKNLSQICMKNKALFVHISTDYVFNGESNKPYTEICNTCPLNVYGTTKLAGENEVINSGCDYVIIRTSWLFSEFGKNFLNNIYGLMKRKTEMYVIGDQIGIPTYAPDLADLIFEVIKNRPNKKKINSLYNFSGDSPISWFGFALMIKDFASRNNNLHLANILKIDSESYMQAAKRPKYSVLSNEKVIDTFGVVPSNWKNALEDIFLGS